VLKGKSEWRQVPYEGRREEGTKEGVRRRKSSIEGYHRGFLGEEKGTDFRRGFHGQRVAVFAQRKVSLGKGQKEEKKKRKIEKGVLRSSSLYFKEPT